MKRVLSSDRGRRFRAFVRSLRRGRPTLWFEHALFPHAPWVFLPSGKRNRYLTADYLRGFGSSAGFHDWFLTRQFEQRHLMQLGFADRLLGMMLARLRRAGLYDRALIAVTADHGLAFDLGVTDRRRVTASSIDEIAPVPLFVKAPGQRRGRVHGPLVRTVDVLPTIARLLGWRVPWRVNGRPLLPRTRGLSRPEMLSTDFTYVRIDRASLARRRRENRSRRLGLFGQGRASLNRIGPQPGLLGRRVRGLSIAPRGVVRASIHRSRSFRQVDLRRAVLPLWVVGTVRGGAAGAERDVAVAVNGRIAATGKSFHLRGRRDELYGVLVPERVLRRGANRVEVFEVQPGERLVRLGATGA